MEISKTGKIGQKLILSVAILLILFFGGTQSFSQDIESSVQIKPKSCIDDWWRERLENVDKSFQSGEITLGKRHDIRAFYLSGLSGDCEEDWKQAVKEFELALTNGEDSISLRVEFGRLLYLKLKDYPKAINQFEHILKQNPRNFDANYNLANLYVLTENWEELLKRGKVLVEMAHRAPGVFYEYYEARALEGLKRYKEAQQKYQRFLEHEEKIDYTSPQKEDARRGLKAVTEILMKQKSIDRNFNQRNKRLACFGCNLRQFAAA